MEKKKKTVNPGGAPPQIVIQNLEVRQWQRTEQSIPNWRKAVQSAESQLPRRYMLYNLYADVDLDGHVQAVTSKRKDAVTTANWKFVDAQGKDVEEINDLIDTIGFNDILEEIINTKFWGYTILEPVFWKNQDGKWQVDAGLIPRLFYRPEIGIVSHTQQGNDGTKIREGIYAKTVMEVGNIKDLGLYMKAAPYQILKRGGLGDYAAFIQVFGNPIVDATWNGFDEKQRLQLKASLDALGAGGSIIRPEGTSIEIKENRTKDTSDAHGSFLRFLNNEISKALLGSTETTESSNSSGYAQSKTHEGQDERKHETDITYSRRVLNSRLIPILMAHGFNVSGGQFMVQGEEEELTKEQMFTIHKGAITELNLPVHHDFLYETYGIPKPDNYNELIKKQEEEQKADSPESVPNGKQPVNPKQQNKAKDPEDPSVKLAEPPFWKRLLRFFVSAPVPKQSGAGAGVAPCGHHHTIKLAETNAFDNDGLIRRIWEAQGKAKEDKELYQITSKTLEDGFNEGWRNGEVVLLADGIEWEYYENTAGFVKRFIDNLYKFAKSKETAMVQLLNELFRKSTSFEEFYQLASPQVEIANKAHLEAEFNTAVLTGEAAATYKRLKDNANVFPFWKYTTMGDELVRQAHIPLDGIVLPHDHPFWKKMYPPNGWRCRCYVVPRMAHEVSPEDIAKGEAAAKEYLDSPAYDKEKKAGWAEDRMGEGFVFSETQQYRYG